MAVRVGTKERREWKDEFKVQPREYQLELLDLALEENTIVNLGTGAGKTFIAVMLIRELQHEIYGEWRDHKRTIFLVPSVPLVDQQAKYVKDHLSLKVGTYKGDMNVDNWDKWRWQGEFEKHHVLVMTHQIFLNILNHFPREIPLTKINLLIVDECHHCTKNHPSREIMRHFDKYRNEDCPRVLGLTASLIKSKIKPHQLEKSIRELESYMRCRCQTAADLIRVENFATQPNEVISQYSSTTDHRIESIMCIISAPLDMVQNFSKEQKRECSVAYDLCKSALDDVQYTLESLGPTSACKVAEDCIKTVVTTYRRQDMFTGDKDKRLLETTHTALNAFLRSLVSVSSGEVQIASKVNCLLRILGDYGIESGETTLGYSGKSSSKKREKLCGIVFVQRRSTAARLCDLVTTLSRTQPDLEYIKCDYLVGHGATGAMKEAMKASKQENVLWRFRKRRINLLIATSVVEEGLDVPHCNLVVRFDLPNDIRSYIQSKGRARARESQFILMVSSTEDSTQRGTLAYYAEMERALRELVKKQRSVPSEDELREAAENEVPPYRPMGDDGPQATLTSSLSLLHMYCQKLPHDSYTNVQPHFTFRKIPRPNLDPLDLYESHTAAYVCTVTLPLPCPYRLPIEGKEMETRRQAERAAALKAVEVLHKHGLLNSDLLPAVKTESEGAGGGRELEELSKLPNAGTDKRRESYGHHVPKILSTCFPSPGEKCHLYACHIKDSDGVFYQCSGVEIMSFGLLSKVQLPIQMIPAFSLFVRDVEVTVTLVEEESVRMTHEELQVLTQFHAYIMEGVLQLAAQGLRYSPGESPNNYLIVPIGIIPALDTCYVDTERAATLASGREQARTAESWRDGQGSADAYVNTVVSKAYGSGSTSSSELYAVVYVDPNTTPSSQFPYSSEGISYSQYFRNKYNAHLRNDHQPALVCEALSKRTDLLTSRFKTRKGEDHEVRKEGVKDRWRITLFPELCKVHPVPASLHRLYHCIPSILWRLESAIAANELRTRIQSTTGVGVIRRGVSEVMTDIDLKGFDSNNVNNLKCVVFAGGEVIPIEDRESLSSNNINATVGPSNAVLLQALTLASAEDIVDLERLEILGDTFLKLSTSVSVFCSQEYHSEGQLTDARSKIVSNLNLFRLARSKDLPSLIAAKPFRARETWIPPCYAIVSGDDHVTSTYAPLSISDKSVADCVESLIGAYLSSGGMTAALLFMQWLGVSLNVMVSLEVGAELQQNFHSPRDFFELVTSPRNVLRNFFLKWEFQDTQLEELQKLQVGLDTLEGVLEYRFQDKRYLVEACTHTSYVRNHVTNCYQRLEFLGDAVLDYLITTFIYQRFPCRSPGELTQLRSALVNNNTFAEMTLKLGLHRLMKHNSSQLFSEIDRYLQDQQDSRANRDHFEVLCTPPTSACLPSCSSIEDDEEDYAEEVCAPKVLGDLIESVAGAIFMDSGMDLRRVWSVFQSHFVPLIDQYSKQLPLNPIDQLFQENPSARFKKLRRTADKGYSVTVKVVQTEGQPPLVANGYAKTEAAAKRIAARGLIKKLNNLTLS
jgi:endoribonuclease Dicer